MKVEFRVQADVIELVLCPTCGAYAPEYHSAECTIELPAPVAETGTKEPVTALALNNMLDPV